MLRLRPFEFRRPASVAEAVELLRSHGGRAKIHAGGTDLMPNMKLAQTDADLVVSLGGIPGLESVEEEDGVLSIGARIRISDLAAHPVVREKLPVLAQAAGRIASPQIRNQGTLGGNICLDTRCRFINQSELFRQALGGCLKSHGAECHVVPGGTKCVAALSADTVPGLVAMDAEVEIIGPAGERRLPLSELYGTDGTAHLLLAKDEVITKVRVPVPGPQTRLAYRKWAVRNSIDFPLVSVAVRLDVADDGTLAGGKAVVGVLGPKPRVVKLDPLAGTALDGTLALQIGELVAKRSKPLPNVPYDPEYRRVRLAVEARRAAADLCR